MTTAPNQPAQQPVWVTVIDPQGEDGRLAITQWDGNQDAQWSVPASASSGDLVLAWVTGGTGFRYVLEIDGQPTPSSPDEAGPAQASLNVIEPINPSVPMTRLKAEPELRSWWLVRYSMQGVVRAQQRSLTEDSEWDAFVRLLGSASPKAAAALRVSSEETAATGTGGSGSAVPSGDTVVFLDDGGTSPVPMTVTRELGSVLARASAINEKRESYDLSFSSLLLAIRYGEDPLGCWLAEYFEKEGVKVEHALSKVRKAADNAEAAARRGTEGRAAILASPLRRTVSARQALEEAARIADGQHAANVDSTHLVAAIIALTNYHEEDFGALTLDRERWGAAFVQFMAQQVQDATDFAFWRRFYTRRFPGHELPPLEKGSRFGHRPDYDADAYTSRDLLAIDDEVSALAYVIAAKQTQPPLAVGLFGEWGSGKTFFMKHLQTRINQICQGARDQKPAERECHTHIAQIEFNAWHYQDGNLWASLVDHILRNLRFGEADEDDAKLAERRSQLVRELDVREAREAAASARVSDVDDRVGKAERRVEVLKTEEKTKRDELATQMTPTRMLAAARAGVTVNDALRKEGEQLVQELQIPVLQANAVGLQEALNAAMRELTGFWSFLVPLVRAKDRRQRLILLGIAIAVPIALGLAITALLQRQELVGKIVAFVTGLGSLIAFVRKWVDKQTTWVREVSGRVVNVSRAVDAAVDEGIETALSAQKQAIADKLAEIERLRQERTEAQKERDDAAAEAATVRSSIALLDEEGLMRAFLDDRIGGGVYQKELGMAALIRRDFERLSQKIVGVTERESAGKLKENELVINRIVLYIDDLDRCEMEKVVPVLRAVHLLLAFKAFVVVVGVDSRWVARCLEQYHPEIFVSDPGEAREGVTPLDYLEKIFQIPIWLEPVAPDRRVSMVRELLRKPVPRPVASRERAPVQEQPAGEPEKNVANPEAPVLAGQDAPAPRPIVQEAPAVETHDEPEEKERIDLNPRGLSITDGEYEFLGRMGSLLSSSPRTIKRFVNTYRLISVALAQAGYRDAVQQPKDYEVRMLLLAILVGMPDLSRWLQESLRETPGNLALTPLTTAMDQSRMRSSDSPSYGYSKENAFAQWEVVKGWIEERGEPWASVPASRIAEWLEPVGRYTFNLTRSASGASLPVTLPPAAPGPVRRTAAGQA